MTTGNRIKYYRKNANLTQNELGQKLGISGAAIAQYETGKRNPKYETLQRIAEALGISTLDLLESTPLGPVESGTTFIKSQTKEVAETAAKLPRKFPWKTKVSNKKKSEIEAHAILSNVLLYESDYETADLVEITETFHELNTDGRRKVIDYAQDLTGLSQYHRLPDSRLILWPHNRNTNKIDQEYYNNLPRVPKVPGMKEYIKCYPIESDEREKYNPYEDWEPMYDGDYLLVEIYTEDFDCIEEAAHFSQAVKKRYFARCVSGSDTGNHYSLAAYVLGDLIRDKFDAEGCYWLLENWAD